MATQSVETVVISNDAVNLLECFHSGLDKMVYSLAEEHARKHKKLNEKGNDASDDPNVLKVSPDDVQFAADAVLQALDQLNLTEAIKNLVKEEMKKCYDEKVCNS